MPDRCRKGGAGLLLILSVLLTGCEAAPAPAAPPPSSALPAAVSPVPVAADVPVYPGAVQLESSDNTSAGMTSHDRTLNVAADPARVEEFYMTELVKNGWEAPEITRDVSARHIVIVETTKGTARSIEITIVPGVSGGPLTIYVAMDEES